MKKRLFYVFIAVAIITNAQQSQDSITTNKLDEVVITDSKFNLKREHSGKTIISINSDEISANKGRNIADIINTKSGIEIIGNRGNSGQILSYFVRGGNNKQVLIIIDGISVTDPSQIANDYDLRLLDLNTIESIEIIKGASSTLYGTNAATAVINITTKKSEKEKINFSASTQIGTNQTSNKTDYDIANFNNHISVNGNVNKFNYLISFNHKFSDGMSEILNGIDDDPFNRTNLLTNIGYQFSKELNVNLFLNHTKIKNDFDTSFSELDQESESKENRFGTNISYKYSDFGEMIVNASHYTFDRQYFNSFVGKSTTLDLYNKYKFNNQYHTIIGLNYVKNQAKFNGTEEIEIIDPYVNLVFINDFGLNINTGMRLNNHSKYGSHFTFSFNPSYNFNMLNGKGKIMTSYGTSYIAPSLYQLYGDNIFVIPNLDLEPEENTTLEVGLEFLTKKSTRISALFFSRKEENFKAYQTIDFTTFQGQYYNSNENVDVNGVEIEFYTKINKNLELNSNYTFVERKRNAALRIPKHKANLNLNYYFKNKSALRLNYQFVGERTDTNFNTFLNEELDAFSLFDLSYQKEIITNRLSFNIQLSNILNEEYTEIIGFSTKGRNILTGLNFNF